MQRIGHVAGKGERAGAMKFPTPSADCVVATGQAAAQYPKLCDRRIVSIFLQRRLYGNARKLKALILLHCLPQDWP
jgi:hypothetical protein